MFSFPFQLFAADPRLPVFTLIFLCVVYFILFIRHFSTALPYHFHGVSCVFFKLSPCSYISVAVSSIFIYYYLFCTSIRPWDLTFFRPLVHFVFGWYHKSPTAWHVRFNSGTTFLLFFNYLWDFWFFSFSKGLSRGNVHLPSGFS